MERKVLGAQNISRMCLVCGAENPAGLHGRFFVLEGGDLLGVFGPQEGHQSYPGRLHGGISSAVLDETIGRAVTIDNPGIWGVTAELTVRYRKPVPLDREIRVLGRIVRDTSRLFEGTGEIVLDDGSVAAEASGRYLKMKLEDITDGDFDTRDWFADPRTPPDGVDL